MHLGRFISDFDVVDVMAVRNDNVIRDDSAPSWYVRRWLSKVGLNTLGLRRRIILAMLFVNMVISSNDESVTFYYEKSSHSLSTYNKQDSVGTIDFLNSLL